MTNSEYVAKVDKLLDILESDNLDGYKRAEIENELVNLKYDYFMGDI